MINLYKLIGLAAIPNRYLIYTCGKSRDARRVGLSLGVPCPLSSTNVLPRYYPWLRNPELSMRVPLQCERAIAGH